MKNLKSACAAVFSQMEMYLNTIPAYEYARKLDVFDGSSIGMHTRHVLDFYTCLFEQSNEVCIDYDKRKRVAEIENDPKAALKAIIALRSSLKSLSTDSELRMKASYSLTDNESSEVISSFGRELVYILEHTIHHLALIRIGLSIAMPSLTLPPEFGVAPSTLKYKAG